MWLGSRRGHLTDWSTQRWVQVTGRRIALADCPWFDGPTGEPSGIGAPFFEYYAAHHGLRLERGRLCGLLEDFSFGAHDDDRVAVWRPPVWLRPGRLANRLGPDRVDTWRINLLRPAVGKDCLLLPLMLQTIEENGVMLVEGPRGTAFMADAGDATRLLEACFAASARGALLYPENLPATFFDLSSGQAGAILQKLRNYGVRLAVVFRQGEVQTSRRFREMMAEEQEKSSFRVFKAREDAVKWLTRRESVT